MNFTLEYLQRRGGVPTVADYLALTYLGDVRSLARLKEDFPEDYPEVMELIQEGRLRADEGEK